MAKRHIQIDLIHDTNEHSLLSILETIYNQIVSDDYISNKHSNINLTDKEGYVIGTIKVGD